MTSALALERGKLGEWEAVTRTEPVWHGKERSVVSILDHGRAPVAKLWFETRSEKLHLMLWTEVASSRFPMQEWDEGAATALAVAVVSAFALPDQVLKGLLRPKDLTPDGRIPVDRSVRRLFRACLRDIRPMGDRHSRQRAELRAFLRRHADVAGDVVLELRNLHQSMPDVKIAEAMDKLRQDMRTLARLGVEFDRIRKAWDEEAVRSVQES